MGSEAFLRAMRVDHALFSQQHYLGQAIAGADNQQGGFST